MANAVQNEQRKDKATKLHKPDVLNLAFILLFVHYFPTVIEHPPSVSYFSSHWDTEESVLMNTCL